MTVSSLTDEFYPLITTARGEVDTIPEDYASLPFSTFVDFTYKFGDNVQYI